MPALGNTDKRRIANLNIGVVNRPGSDQGGRQYAQEPAVSSFTLPDGSLDSSSSEEGTARRSLESPTGLFWSLRGSVLCEAHAAQVDGTLWITERWEPLPRTSQGFHGDLYQCQRCSPDGTALVRTSSDSGVGAE